MTLDKLNMQLLQFPLKPLPANWIQPLITSLIRKLLHKIKSGPPGPTQQVQHQISYGVQKIKLESNTMH